MISYFTDEGEHANDDVTRSVIPDVAPAGCEHRPDWALREYAPSWATRALAVGDWWPAHLQGFWKKVGNMWLLDFTHKTLDLVGMRIVVEGDSLDQPVIHELEEYRRNILDLPNRPNLSEGSNRYWLYMDGERIQISQQDFEQGVIDNCKE